MLHDVCGVQQFDIVAIEVHYLIDLHVNSYTDSIEKVEIEKIVLQYKLGILQYTYTHLPYTTHHTRV